MAHNGNRISRNKSSPKIHNSNIDRLAVVANTQSIESRIPNVVKTILLGWEYLRSISGSVVLVTFKSKSHGDITMFGTVAKSLLKMMGQSGNIPGAIMAADLGDARSSLTEKLEKVEPQSAAETNDGDDDGETAVSLSKRALPLLEMFDSAIENGDNIMWE